MMIHKLDLLALKAKLHNDYHNLNTAIHNTINNNGSADKIESLYENLVESGFECISSILKQKEQKIKLLRNQSLKLIKKDRKTQVLYPYINKKSKKQ